MTLRRIDVHNFRGVRALSWLPGSGLTCLIGPGNSTKTTLLDAITIALSPRFTIGVSDSDFFNCDVDQQLTIEVVVGDVPDSLLSLDRFGDMVCGIKSTGELTTDPEDDTDPCLAIRFSSDRSLEPTWEVTKPDTTLAKRISAGARAELGMFRIDERVETHMKWARGSALTMLTGAGTTASTIVTEAYRSARAAVFRQPDPNLTAAAESVKEHASQFGAGHYDDIKPGLDPSGQWSGFGLVLHDGNVPLTAQGLGARRLTSVAIQHAGAASRSLILVDEVELGLEPHRLHRLLRMLNDSAATGQAQVIMTTHSPVVVEGISAHQLAIVRSCDGVTNVTPISPDVAGSASSSIQGVIRNGPSAMLASRIVVAEGPTELGVLRAYATHWDSIAPEPLAVIGTAFKDGKGDEGTLLAARQLADLGYPTAALLDSDNPLADEEQSARNAGVVVVRWEGVNALEQRVALDVPNDALANLIELAIALRDDNSEEAVLQTIEARLPQAAKSPRLSGSNPLAWVSENRSIESIRTAIGVAAHKGKWFKSETKGEALGKLLLRYEREMRGSDLAVKLEAVRRFSFAEEETPDAAQNAA